MKKKSVSQQQIARNLGVSQALVSLVLNGNRKNISRESYDRIWNYATHAGYRPKGMQITDNRVMSGNVGFILRAGVRLYTQSNYYSHIQHGLHIKLLEREFHTFFFGSEDDVSLKEFQNKLRHHRLFGLIVLGQIAEPFLRGICAVQKNVVAVSAIYPGLCNSVMPNEEQSLQMLVDHLWGLGHRRFAWIGGNRLLKHNIRRREALINLLKHKEVGLAEKSIVEMANGDRLDGWRAAETMLGRIAVSKNHPTAWICLNGLMSRGVINCLNSNGWNVPARISVAAVDATQVCIEENPRITGAHANPEKTGEKAAELLLQASTNTSQESFVDVIMPATLTVRETTAKVR